MSDSRNNQEVVLRSLRCSPLSVSYPLQSDVLVLLRREALKEVNNLAAAGFPSQLNAREPVDLVLQPPIDPSGT